LRHTILRAGIIAALVALAATAQASPSTSTIAHEPEPPQIDAARPGPDSAPAWMTDALLGAFSRTSEPAGAGSTPAGAATLKDRDRLQSSKPHQNPAFPAAFVFQSNSALFLAASTDARTQRPSPAGS
jgi:hypothetical protein